MSQNSHVEIASSSFFSYNFRLVRHRGGLCIAIENQTGLGRTGHYWAFQVIIELIPRHSPYDYSAVTFIKQGI